MARFIYGDRRTEYIETDLTGIQLIRDEEKPITYKPPKGDVEMRLYIPLQAEPFIGITNQIPAFEYDKLQPIAKIVGVEAYIEIDYVKNGCIETLEWGNITTRAEYDYTSSFIRKCIDRTEYAGLTFCESFEDFVKFLIVYDLQYENDVFSDETAALLAEKILPHVFEANGNNCICSETMIPKETWKIANKVLLELMK